MVINVTFNIPDALSAEVTKAYAESKGIALTGTNAQKKAKFEALLADEIKLNLKKLTIEARADKERADADVAITLG